MNPLLRGQLSATDFSSRRGMQRRGSTPPDPFKAAQFWLECICFIIIATPFELAIGSGYAYLIKAVAALIIPLPWLLTGKVTVSPQIGLVLILAVLFLLINLQEPSLRSAHAFSLIILGGLIGFIKGEAWIKQLSAVVTVYIVFNLLGFTVAMADFFIRGNVIDLHGMLFSTSSRAYSIGSAARLSGFHNEPGTYAQWMLMATFLRCLLTRRITSVLTVAVGVSMLLTVSLWAVIGVLLLATAIALEILMRANVNQKVRALTGAALLLMAGTLVFSIIPDSIVQDVFAYLGIKSELNTESGLNKILALREIQDKFFDILFIGSPMEPGFCPQCLSPQDLGTWATGAFYFGVLPFGLLLLYAARKLVRWHGLPYLPLLGAMLVWKATFYDPMFWMIMSYMITSTPHGRLMAGGAQPPPGLRTMRPV